MDFSLLFGCNKAKLLKLSDNYRIPPFCVSERHLVATLMKNRDQSLRERQGRTSSEYNDDLKYIYIYLQPVNNHCPVLLQRHDQLYFLFGTVRPKGRSVMPCLWNWLDWTTIKANNVNFLLQGSNNHCGQRQRQNLKIICDYQKRIMFSEHKI